MGLRWLWNYLLKILVWKVRKLDDHRILMKGFKRSEFWWSTSAFNHSITGFDSIVSNKIEVKGKARIFIRILQSFVFENRKSWHKIRWQWNSSRISIRILVVNAANCGIHMGFSEKPNPKVWASDFFYSGAVHVFFTNNWQHMQIQ